MLLGIIQKGEKKIDKKEKCKNKVFEQVKGWNLGYKWKGGVVKIVNF